MTYYVKVGRSPINLCNEPPFRNQEYLRKCHSQNDSLAKQAEYNIVPVLNKSILSSRKSSRIDRHIREGGRTLAGFSFNRKFSFAFRPTAEIVPPKIHNADPKQQYLINPLIDYGEFQDEQEENVNLCE